MPHEALRHVDAVVQGYAEETWPQLLRDFKTGNLKSIYCKDTLDPSLIVAPDRKHIRRSQYVANNTVEMSRGCNKRCDFCVTHRLNTNYLTKDIDTVMEEIRSMPGKLITFLDPNLIGNITYAYKFFKALRKLNKYWVGCVSIDVLKYPDLLDLLGESGGKGFLIGFESLNQEALDSANKSFSQVEDYYTGIDLFHQMGIMVQGSFVLGFDCDDTTIFQRTIDFVINAHIDLPQFTIYTPFPGSVVYHRMLREGRLLTHDWSKYNGHEVVFQPARMSPHELQEGVNAVWDQVYAIPAILKRLNSRPYLLKPIAFMSNLNFRRFMKRVHFGR
jgi:radical SAM superfamily enzyme YgiQ (UPF0313 family)